MAVVRAICPGQQPRRYPVMKPIVTVGSSPECDVVLEVEGVAPEHCQIYLDGESFHISSFGRDTPVVINGKRRRRHILRHGDQLGLGAAALQFSMFCAPAAGEAPATSTSPNRYRELFDFSNRLLGAYDLDGVLEELMDAAIAVTRADRGFLVLFEGGEPRVKVGRNLQRESIPDAVEQLSDSIIAKVVESHQPIIVSDALRDDQFSSAQSVLNLGLLSVMCVPLTDRGTLIGLIYVGSNRVVELFDDPALEALTVLAAHASLVIRNALLINELELDNRRLNLRLEETRMGQIVGDSEEMQDIFRKIEKVATTDVSVLITGETGTGKELVATAIHERSNRRSGPLVTINCGAIPENLLESELFGHVKGAFTGAVADHRGKFEAAHGGTLFLDEVGELPFALQVKLLRALQEKTIVRVGAAKPRPVDIRIVAATNKDLGEEMRAGRFRDDLYYRLNVIHLALPPLRERGDDLLVIAQYLLQRAREEFGSRVSGFAPGATMALKGHSWPGNIRELQNRIKKAVVLADGVMLSAGDLDLEGQAGVGTVKPLAEARDEWQREYINDALARNGGNRSKTARDLGVDPRTIFRHLEREEELRSSGG